MLKKRIYLDANSTTPPLPQVRSALIAALDMHGNPSAQHLSGKNAKARFEKTRTALAQHMGAAADQIIFTSGGTEANNQALRAAPWKRVLVSSIEHDSVFKAREDVEVIPALSCGLVDLEALDRLLFKTGPLTLVSVMLANNETGIIQPLSDIVRIAKKSGAFVHTDATQAFGKIDVSFDDLGVDLMTLSFHKVGGPIGIGALIAKESTNLSALIQGGGQEKNRRSGIENIWAAEGLLALLQDLPDLSHLRSWHDEMEKTLGAFVFGQTLKRLPNTTCLVLKGVPNQNQMMFFDLNGIAVSVGSACSSSRLTTARTLAVLPEVGHLAPFALRVSSGWHTERHDLYEFAALWKKLSEKQNLSHPRIPS